MKAIKNTFKELLRYPSAIVGLVIIANITAMSVYAMVTIPYKQATYPLAGWGRHLVSKPQICCNPLG